MLLSVFEASGVRFPPSTTAPCGDIGRSAAAPATPLSAPPRWVTSGRCCLPLQSPARRSNTRRDAGQPMLGHSVPGKKGRHKAGHAHRMLLQTTEAFHRAEQTWSRQSRSPGRPPPGRPGWDARCPGGEGSRGLCKASAPPVVRLRAQLPPEVAPRGESTGRILS